MFLDEATIEVSGGHGGRGCVSWRREKYISKGGPDGGDGGKGGDVFLLADDNTDTLSVFASKKRFEADKGRYGMGRNKTGASGEDLILHVPPGTVASEVTPDGKEVPLADLAHSGDQMLIARGGRGGYGNAHFKSSVRQRPDFAELGEPGEKKKLKLDLKLVADVGIIGYPSVGKSTLISVISAARPKIAEYPFTTLVPNLGVVTVADRSYIVCDVPGLIEGAAEGKGLGDTFLRHIERCGVLVHLLDLSHALGPEGKMDADVLVKEYRAIRKELEAYSPTLAKKRELVVLNKIDLTTEDLAPLAKALNKEGIDLFMNISAATKSGVEDLIKALLPIVLEEREKRVALEQERETKLPVLKPHLASREMGAYRIEKKEDGSLLVHGKRLEQFTKMTDFSSQGGVRRFRDVIERIGLKKAIVRERETDDTSVFIGDVRVDEFLL